jgi:SAM-dependent methyltransferase
VRRGHFDSLRPVCPVCQSSRSLLHPLVLASVDREDGGQIIEGVLHCSDVNCQREYPIIDGIPLIIRDIRRYLSENAFQVCQRDDLGPTIESMLGDCCGAGSPYDVARQHLSSYAWDHYGDQDPEEGSSNPRPGSLLRVLRQGLEMAGELPPGPILDIGCSVGRSTFALAERYDRMVLGVDLNYSMLRLASEVLRSGVVRYPRRRVGLVYDRREFPVSFKRQENVDFWACDAMAFPFEANQFAAAVSLNMLDCVHSPLDFLSSLAAVLGEDCPAVLSCPYDWSVSATPLEGWLGGHSQRSADAGASEPVLRRLLTAGTPQSIEGLRMIAECDADWHVRLHDRSTVSYKSHLVAART